MRKLALLIISILLFPTFSYAQWRNLCIYNDDPPAQRKNVDKDAYTLFYKKWRKVNADLAGVTIRLKGSSINEDGSKVAQSDGLYYIFYSKHLPYYVFLVPVDEVKLKKPSDSNPEILDDN